MLLLGEMMTAQYTQNELLGSFYSKLEFMSFKVTVSK